MIKQGLKIFSKLDLTERIQLSSGLKPINRINDTDAAENTFVAKDPWVSPTNEENKILIASVPDVDCYQIIGLIKLPGRTINQIKSIGFTDYKSKNDFNTFLHSVNYTRLSQLMKSFFIQYQIINEPQIEIGLDVKEPQLEGTTINTEIKKFIGLHTDNWENAPLSERHRSRNRICVNLGLSDRYFIFINLSFKEICSSINYNTVEHFLRDRKEITKTFMSQNLTYQAVRVKVQPFEAYIAPTENIIHDGMLDCRENLDVTFTCRSYYKVSLTTK